MGITVIFLIMGHAGFCPSTVLGAGKARSAYLAGQKELKSWLQTKCLQEPILANSISRFLSSPFVIRVPFFPIFSFNKETRKYYG